MINQEINSKKRRKLKAVECKINFKEKIEEFMLKITAKYRLIALNNVMLCSF